MKFIRFKKDNKEHYGIIDGDKIKEIEGSPFSGYVIEKKTYDFNNVEILAPTLFSKAVCIGLNYRDHAMELGLEIPKSPVVFIKPSTTINDPDHPISAPSLSNRIDYEAELAIVIKKECKNIEEKDAKDYILGYCCANDVTARDLQPKDGQWTISKSFDGFLPLGPYIDTEFIPLNKKIECFVNGKLRQSSNIDNLIFKGEYLVSYLSKCMCLNEGDIILTGTPSGIGKLEKGDEVVVKIEGLGELKSFLN